MMKYSAVLLCLGVTVALGQTVVKTGECPKGDNPHLARPASLCEDVYGFQCYNPQCYECQDGEKGYDMCPGHQKCCVPKLNKCENTGGVCEDPMTSNCYLLREDLEGWCDDPALQCCQDNGCWSFKGGRCLNRNLVTPESCEIWEGNDQNYLCGGPDWVQCCYSKESEAWAQGDTTTT